MHEFRYASNLRTGILFVIFMIACVLGGWLVHGNLLWFFFVAVLFLISHILVETKGKATFHLEHVEIKLARTADTLRYSSIESVRVAHWRGKHWTIKVSNGQYLRIDPPLLPRHKEPLTAFMEELQYRVAHAKRTW